MNLARPRVVLAGVSGDAGKTLISLVVLLEARRRGLAVRAFKKGPDYIDTAWLSWASGAPARNLDSYLMGFDQAVAGFAANGTEEGLNLVEGNRGLYDGFDDQGSHSTAELAKALNAPVILVVNAAKVTRTVSAVVLGCQHLDPCVQIGGVILNHVNGERHETILRNTIESACGIPILGAIPDAPEGFLLPSRHLGLVTPAEHPNPPDLTANLLGFTSGHFDFERLLEIAQRAPAMYLAPLEHAPKVVASGVKIGFLRDSAFTFYYPENLEALCAEGAELLAISALSAAALPDDLDALYIGGGFPETHARQLSANTTLLGSIRERSAKGLPIYAECGGLMLLSRSMAWRGCRYPMAGVLPLEIEVCPSQQGHGYVELLVDTPNPFFAMGLRIKGHEFHYSRVAIASEPAPATACAVPRGTGCYAKRDGVITGNVWAGYTHLHAVATPEWARGFVRLARSARCLALS